MDALFVVHASEDRMAVRGSRTTKCVSIFRLDVARRIDALEGQMEEHAAGNERHFRVVFEALRKLMDERGEPVEQPDKIGFQVDDVK